MTENQLRDVLSRVVPEAPAGVTDAGPIVRVARRRRRTRIVGLSGLTAALVAGTLLGVRAAGDDEPSLVVDQPPIEIADPYTTAPCPATSDASEWPLTTRADLATVTAVRFCGRPVNGFPTANGAPDALVTGLDGFRADVGALTTPDPGRCAAIDVMPTDSRLLLLLADGTSVGIPTGLCQDVELGGRTADASDVVLAFVDSLRAQRDAHEYALPEAESAPLDCSTPSDVSPAAPGRETLTGAILCVGGEGEAGTALTPDQLAALDDAWGQGAVLDRQGSSICEDQDFERTIRARTDRGDILTIQPGSEGGACNQLTYTSWLVRLPVERPDETWLVMLPAYVLPLGIDDLTGG